MGDQHVPGTPQSDKAGRSTNAPADAAAPTPKQQQATAHARGRICKVRSCTVCAPLREQRRLKKAQRKADAQAQAHAKGVPCGRANCSVPDLRSGTPRRPGDHRSGRSGHRRAGRRRGRGAAPTGGEAPSRPAVRLRDLRQPGVHRRLRAGTSPAPPRPTALQVLRMRPPDLRGEPSRRLIRPFP